MQGTGQLSQPKDPTPCGVAIMFRNDTSHGKGSPAYPTIYRPHTAGLEYLCTPL